MCSPFGVHVEKGLFLGRSKQQVLAMCVAAMVPFFVVSCFLVKLTAMAIKGSVDELSTMSLAMQVYSFFVLCKSMRRSHSSDEVSSACVGLFGLASVARLIGTGQYRSDGVRCFAPLHVGAELVYLPLELAYAATAAYAMFLVTVKYQNNGVAPRRYMPVVAVVGLVVASVVLGIWTKTTCSNVFFADAAFAVSLWLDAIALLPQLWVVAADNGTNRLTSQFIAGMVLSKVVSGIWWCTQLTEDQNLGRFYVCIFGTHLVALVTGADYMYHFFMAKKANRLELEEFGHAYRV